MAVDTFEATVGDVAALLRWDVRNATDPTPEAVTSWIVLGAAELFGLVGAIAVDSPCGGDAYRTRARHVVALYAAAMAEDAHYPERIKNPRAGDYGARLWDRHVAQRDALLRDISACRDGVDSGSAHGGAAHSFPSPPMFARDMPG